MPDKRLQARMAHRSGMSFSGKPIRFDLRDRLGFPIPEEELYHPQYRESCAECGSRPICNGCSNCGKCK